MRSNVSAATVMPDRRVSPFVAPDCWHSFDDGQHWNKGRPPIDVERGYPGTIRYHLAGDPPVSHHPRLDLGDTQAVRSAA